MPVPGSQVVGFRPLRGHEERLCRDRPEFEPVEEKWPLAVTLRFVVASGVVLWAAIGLLIGALL